MLKRIATIGVPVTDQQRSVDFFTDVLGMDKRVDAPMGPDARWVELVPKGAPDGPALVPYTWMGAEAEVGTSSRVVLETDDLDGWYGELAAKGVEFEGEPFDDPQAGRFATLRDPDGNTFILAQLNR